MIPVQLKAVRIFYLCKHIYSVLSIMRFICVRASVANG